MASAVGLNLLYLDMVVGFCDDCDLGLLQSEEWHD
jgi:hypothetical protein